MAKLPEHSTTVCGRNISFARATPQGNAPRDSSVNQRIPPAIVPAEILDALPRETVRMRTVWLNRGKRSPGNIVSSLKKRGIAHGVFPSLGIAAHAQEKKDATSANKVAIAVILGTLALASTEANSHRLSLARNHQVDDAVDRSVQHRAVGAWCVDTAAGHARAAPL
jgi:hypothetical protein